MAFNDLTLARLQDFHSKLNALEEDLSDLIGQKQNDNFELSTQRKVDNSREDSVQYPSKYYCFRMFDKYIEVRRIGRSDKYCVLLSGFDLPNHIRRTLEANYGDFEIELNFNQIKLLDFDFETSISLFESVVCLITNLPVLRLL